MQDKPDAEKQNTQLKASLPGNSNEKYKNPRNNNAD
jgi:hypothetical protein